MTWPIARSFSLSMKIICAFFFLEGHAEGWGEHSCLATVNTYTSEMAVPTMQT